MTPIFVNGMKEIHLEYGKFPQFCLSVKPVQSIIERVTVLLQDAVP